MKQKNLQIIQPQTQVSTSGKHRKTPLQCWCYYTAHRLHLCSVRSIAITSLVPNSQLVPLPLQTALQGSPGRILAFTEQERMRMPRSKRLQQERWEDSLLQDWCTKLIFTPPESISLGLTFLEGLGPASPSPKAEVTVGLLTPLKASTFWTGKNTRKPPRTNPTKSNQSNKIPPNHTEADGTGQEMKCSVLPSALSFPPIFRL